MEGYIHRHAICPGKITFAFVMGFSLQGCGILPYFLTSSLNSKLEDRPLKICEDFFNSKIQLERKWNLQRRFDVPAKELAEKIDMCKPSVTGLLQSGSLGCTNAIMQGNNYFTARSEDEANSVCAELAAIANDRGYHFPGGNNLSFNRDCKSMQSHFNQSSWSSKTRFEGFEDKEHLTGFGSLYCDGGYITEESPMGTKTCVGQMRVSFKSSGGYNISWNSQSCRWKQ